MSELIESAIDQLVGDVHPLDRKAKYNFGITGPEENYHKRVKDELSNIMQTSRNVSEKSFTEVDSIIAEADKLVRVCDTFVRECEVKRFRPSLCAEMVYAKKIEGIELD